MPVALLFIGGIFTLLALGSRRAVPPTPPARVLPRATAGGTRVAGGPPMVPGYWVAHVRRLAANHIRPPEWAVNEAVREAFDSGDVAAVVDLCNRFGAPAGLVNPAAAADATSQAANLAEGHAGHPSATVSGRSSPLDGVDNQEWDEYVRRLATEQPDHRTERHIGRFHHSLERIRQLGLTPPTDEESQYQALAADTADAFERCHDLFRDFLAQVIEVDGQPVPVTRSGLLGLIKAAGPDGARSWLTNQADRTTYPRTTATFLSTNGVF